MVDILKNREAESQLEIAAIIQAALIPKPKNDPERRPAEFISAHTPNSPIITSLEPVALKAEQLLRNAGSSCLEYPNGAAKDRDSSRAPLALLLPPRKDMDSLCALGIAIPLDRNLFIHREAYLQLVSRTLKTKNHGDSLEISEAKERTGFSRKFIIPFLNRMERDGYIKRDGERRVILILPLPPAVQP